MLKRPRPPCTPRGYRVHGGLGLFNIPFTTSATELEALLGQYPGYQEMKMVSFPDGSFKGYLFAYFDSTASATAAKEMMMGLTIGGQSVDVKYARQSSDERDAKAAAKAAMGF
eukprot:NODE_633_length_1250_cov_364.630308_g458_i0.p3 GENE.NODE_633_length_1250_cov_364.630308_g458_i0~~NODE_633_length_1250_cov_364.630308_g458_i0.p3  ORF type:complete len:113 (+),score=54.15 NODE_633_length_1250_cov_364.630308_g458_i0:589-927(+)